MSFTDACSTPRSFVRNWNVSGSASTASTLAHGIVSPREREAGRVEIDGSKMHDLSVAEGSLCGGEQRATHLAIERAEDDEHLA